MFQYWKNTKQPLVSLDPEKVYTKIEYFEVDIRQEENEESCSFCSSLQTDLHTQGAWSWCRWWWVQVGAGG